MPINALKNTEIALGLGLFPKCDSRSLYKDRFSDPQAKKDAQKNWFEALCKKPAVTSKRTPWLPVNAEALYARLMSRLMVDLSGGVMENANVNLNRYGFPVIPGSAVKGCARRMALQAMHDWIAAGTPRPADDDACAPCCEGFEKPEHMLAAIARIFGWVELDWKSGKKDDLYASDFGWACGERLEETWAAAAQELASAHHWKLQEEKPWTKLPDFAGTISFLHASPHTDPGIELDVLTPHHKGYYEGKLKTATDTEDPVPIFFPAVKSQAGNQNYFTFPLIPLLRAKDGDLALAKRWLSHGLSLFGLGAKTAAGYGWFEDVTETIAPMLLQQKAVAVSIRSHKDFDSWPADKKDEAILTLADQSELCAAWKSISMESFHSIHEYAAQQGLTL